MEINLNGISDRTFNNKEVEALVDNFRKSVDYNFDDDTLDAELYVSHPVEKNTKTKHLWPVL